MGISSRLYLLLLVLHFTVVLLLAFNTKPSAGKRMTRGYAICFAFLCVTLALLVAYRPLGAVPDSQAYYDRFYTAPLSTNLSDILRSSSFYRGTAYSMSKLVNALFYGAYKLGFSFRQFSFSIALIELCIFFVYTRKTVEVLDLKWNAFFILLITLIFYSYRYQFVAVAQGMGMCLIAPIFYFFIKKSYFKAIILVGIICMFHVAEFYVIPVLCLFAFTPKMKSRTYLIIWILIGLLQFTGLAYRLGGSLTGFAGVIINRIISTNTVYEAYASGKAGFGVSLSSILLWLYLGLLVFSRNDNNTYWKLVNVVLLSILIAGIFARWDIVHRFTDNSKMLFPVVTMLFFNKSRFKFEIADISLKRCLLLIFILLLFISNIRLLSLL